ncbi:MAG TPA: L-threonylcarbamoyladenylate synthase [Methanocorpusculum sp.]|nr:threonylcarbamoyl-AMP synthase [Lachnospiraceae bacterium]MDO5829061.1 L-threonylcarbamoyladenylate synthase [Methanocorpusculum sp.]HJJ26664.1 L-threonylcarbamoyladenylate synthase [Methanocorpusculum sp.]
MTSSENELSLDEQIEKAVSVLSRDGLIVYPTETVYGLGADALSETAVMNVYQAKKRLLGKPISVAVSDIEMIYGVAEVDDISAAFIKKFLPGPVTVILRAKDVLPSELTGGTGMIGIRYPDHQTALKLIEVFDCPITATSANLAGEVSPVTAEMVNVPHDYLIDGGVLAGTPSTVVNLAERKIVRPGAMLDEVAEFLKEHL